MRLSRPTLRGQGAYPIGDRATGSVETVVPQENPDLRFTDPLPGPLHDEPVSGTEGTLQSSLVRLPRAELAWRTNGFPRVLSKTFDQEIELGDAEPRFGSHVR